MPKSPAKRPAPSASARTPSPSTSATPEQDVLVTPRLLTYGEPDTTDVAVKDEAGQEYEGESEMSKADVGKVDSEDGYKPDLKRAKASKGNAPAKKKAAEGKVKPAANKGGGGAGGASKGVKGEYNKLMLVALVFAVRPQSAGNLNVSGRKLIISRSSLTGMRWLTQRVSLLPQVRCSWSHCDLH